jgi:NADH-quinone oxidoreductase subunit A
MNQYLPIVVLTVLAVVFGVLSLVASKLLAPRRPNTAKDAPYECGIVPSRESPERFPVSFYIVAMLFIMFDIEIIFAYPYAVAHEALGAFGFWEMFAFSAVFFVAFVYVVAQIVGVGIITQRFLDVSFPALHGRKLSAAKAHFTAVLERRSRQVAVLEDCCLE